jgi:succinate dehydrogenase/fumarate reductase cytochrome b subunit
MTTKKIHFISGLTITVFVGLHLFNHTLSIFGSDTHIEIMNTLRLFYRNIFFETVLLIAVLVQIISGLNLFKTNRKIATTPLFLERCNYNAMIEYVTIRKLKG